jgi:hypothetical protein
MRILLLVVCILTMALPAQAENEFNLLANRLPRSTNALVLLDVKGAINSPLGEFEGWSKDLEKAFNAGITRVPPQAERFVLAAEIDFEYMKPIWEAAAVEIASPISLSQVIKKRGGTSDTIESFAAVALPEDAYLIKFDEHTLGAIGPANRKLAVNWMRDMKEGLKLTPYLQKAANFSDSSGSEVIVAVDLYGAFSLERIVEYLKQKPAIKEGDASIQKAAMFLASVQGVRLGIRLSNPPVAAVAIDCEQKCELDDQAAKDALLQVLADGGVLLEEMRDWKCSVKDHEVALSGKLTKDGLRRVLSLVDSPTSSNKTSADATESKTEPTAESSTPQSLMAEKTKQQYQAVTEMFDDLKKDLKTIDNLNVNATWFDRYAKRIERLPILNVDPVMLDYSSYVAASLRAASVSVRTMGIRGGSRQAQVDTSDVQYDYSYGYRSGWDGTTAWAAPYTAGVNEYKEVAQDRRKIRAEEKGIAATDIHKIRDNVIDATTKVRRAMTEKYQIEF